MQPPVHQWKADTVARQPLPGGWEVGGGGWCFRKEGGMPPEIHGWDGHRHLQNLHLGFISQHKDRKTVTASEGGLIINGGRRGRLGRSR